MPGVWSLPVNIKITDQNTDADFLAILPDTVTGGATYDSNTGSIVWEGALVPGLLQKMFTFDVEVIASPCSHLGIKITNTAYMYNKDISGSLSIADS